MFSSASQSSSSSKRSTAETPEPFSKASPFLDRHGPMKTNFASG